MPLMLDDIRAEFARHLADHAAARFSMDKALAHVVTLAYRHGMADGAAEAAERIRDLEEYIAQHNALVIRQTIQLAEIQVRERRAKGRPLADRST